MQQDIDHYQNLIHKTMNKQYRHKETGEIWNGGSVVLMRDGNEVRIFNPTPQHLADAGYEEYIPEPYVPTEREIALQRMAEINAELQSLDYLTSKEIDGEDMSEYHAMYGGDYHAYRSALRAEYNQLEEKTKGE